MRHADVECSGMVERYIQGRLEGEELERFEDHFFECPECLEQLELAEALQQGIRQTAATEAGRFLQPAAPAARATPGRRRRWLAAAALVIVSLTALGLLTRVVPFTGDVSGPGPVANTPVFFLGVERSESDLDPVTRIKPRPGVGGLVLALEMAAATAEETFEARLVSRESPEDALWNARGLEIDHNGTVSLSLPIDFLEPGDYSIEVWPSAAEPVTAPREESTAAERFAFRILPPE